MSTNDRGTRWVIVDDDAVVHEESVVMTGFGVRGGVNMARRLAAEKRENAIKYPQEHHADAIHLYVELNFE